MTLYSAPPDTFLGTAPKRHFIFVLLDNFTMLSFAGAVEALRVANRMLGTEYYSWKILSQDGGAVTCSNGLEFNVTGELNEQVKGNDIVILCGGINIQAATTKRLLTWLRRISRQGVSIGGLCTAGYVLARAGLLDGKKATIHWENQDSFEEMFPEIELTKSVYTIDGSFITVAGGGGSIDLLLKIIAENNGVSISNRVADGMVYNGIRTDSDSQRLSIPIRIGVRHPKLSAVVKKMEQSIETPMSSPLMAKEVAISTRQLERLFRRYLNRSPKRYYMELRLRKARGLLLQTDMSIINIALACGFSSSSHFSKCYRSQYMTTPYREHGARAWGDG